VIELLIDWEQIETDLVYFAWAVLIVFLFYNVGATIVPASAHVYDSSISYISYSLASTILGAIVVCVIVLSCYMVYLIADAGKRRYTFKEIDTNATEGDTE
jgi:heme/copper-type cytochrome/quinol oxidase subunit 2